ncbi:MAG: hypothetical protein J5I50_10795 [Chitinophagaceae bacterium]|nr:hypothetical protein [Chitinophagaceae bacterium]
MKRLYFVFTLITVTLVLSCTQNVAKIDNSLEKYFEEEGVTGTFALLNNQMGDISVYNIEMDTMRLSPGNSIKIIASLVGIESATLTDSKSVLSTGSDSAQSEISLKDAFHDDNMGYFKTLMNEIGKDTMTLWIDSLKYGNMNSERFESFWSDGSLKISPDEQMGLISKIYFDKLPFKKYSQAIARELMLQEDNTLYRYSYTTSSAQTSDGNPMAWVLGWIEENKHVYFFTCVATSSDKNKDIRKTSLKVVNNILTAKGFFKGKK